MIKVFTHLNSLKTKSKDEQFTALQSDKIVFNGQPIALVVAETFEQASYAANLIKAEYTEEKHQTETEKANTIPAPAGFGGVSKPRGNPQKALQDPM